MERDPLPFFDAFVVSYPSGNAWDWIVGGTSCYTVRFTDARPEAAAGFSYTWTFGDGTTGYSTTRSTDHRYTTAGDYPVMVTVSDGTSYVGTVHISTACSYKVFQHLVLFPVGTVMALLGAVALLLKRRWLALLLLIAGVAVLALSFI